jgi:undecaprenyl-diphosphatase
VIGRVARPAAGALRRAMPGLRFVWNRLTPGGLGLEFTTLLAIAAVGAFVVVGYAITLSVPGELTAGDRRGVRWGRRIETPWLTDLSGVVAQLGALPVAGTAVVLVAAGLLARRQVLEAVALASGLVLTVVLVEVVQGMEGRIAPPDPLAELTAGTSFPSGHAAYGIGWIAIALALRRALPNLPSRAVLLSRVDPARAGDRGVPDRPAARVVLRRRRRPGRGRARLLRGHRHHPGRRERAPQWGARP